MAQQKERSLKRQIVETFRRSKKDGDRVDNFDFSFANQQVASTPVMIYDLSHLTSLVSQVYAVLGRRGGPPDGRRNGVDGPTPNFNGRQKQVIAFCIYIEERGDVCTLNRFEDGTPCSTFRTVEEKHQFIDALCILNGLERRKQGAAIKEFVHGGADYVADHVNAIEAAGGVDLEDDDEDEEDEIETAEADTDTDEEDDDSEDSDEDDEEESD